MRHNLHCTPTTSFGWDPLPPPSDAPQCAASHQQRGRFSLVPTKQKIVAVVDDDTSTLKAIERLLSARGFQVETWLSAEAFLASGASRYANCLLLDIHLSQMSGLELRRQLAHSGCTAPIIFMTGNHDERTRQEALKAGCADFLRKPFSSHILFAAIARAMSRELARWAKTRL
jgi:FixJ family two-component response regulator